MIVSTSPLTGETVGSFPIATPGAVADAVGSARAAARWWREIGARERRHRLLRWSASLARRYDEAVDLIRLETGKTTADARIEVLLTIHHLRWAANNAHRVLRRRRVSSGMLMFNHSARLEHRPVGVVGVIGPWNYPLFTPMGSIAYALAAGNAVVFKPSEHTPAVGVWLEDSFAPFSDGHAVLRCVTGDGSTGAALCAAGVDKLAFTGSTATAKKIMAACAPTLTPVVIEAGGKDALIVDADADPEAAADAALWGGMANAGQACIGVERVLVHEAVYEAFIRALEARSALSVGVSDDAAIGPITTVEQATLIRAQLADAATRGAQFVVGDARGGEGRLIPPTVVLGAPMDARVMAEETFGPVLSIRRVASMDEAVRLANSTRYGLGGAVFSRRNGVAIARRLESGMVSVNAVLAFAAIPALPYGGTRDSGFGRIHGADGLREFTTVQAITTKGPLPSIDLMTFTRNARVDRLLPSVVRRLFG